MSHDETLPPIHSLWNYSRPDESEARFREALPRAIAAADEGYRLELLTQIARAQGLQRRFDDAHDTLDTVENDLGERSDAARLRYLLERGRVFNSSGEPEKARRYFVEAWELGTAAGIDDLAIDAAHMVAIVESGEDALEWNRVAFEHAEKSDDERARRWIGSLTNNIGWTFHDMGRYEEALGYFERYAAWSREIGAKGESLIARWCVARALRSLGRIEEALERQLALKAERIAEDMPEDGYVSEEIAECLLALGRSDQAREHFAKAYELLSTDAWLQANQGERLERLKRLGAV